MREIMVSAAMMAFLAFAMSFSAQPLCSTEVGSRAMAPNGRWQAIEFHHRCGNGASGTELVSIFPMGGPTSGAGNVFVSADATRAPATGRIDLRWPAPGVLQVIYDRRACVFHQWTTMGPIQIRYATAR